MNATSQDQLLSLRLTSPRHSHLHYDAGLLCCRPGGPVRACRTRYGQSNIHAATLFFANFRKWLRPDTPSKMGRYICFSGSTGVAIEVMALGIPGGTLEGDQAVHKSDVSGQRDSCISVCRAGTDSSRQDSLRVRQYAGKAQTHGGQKWKTAGGTPP